MGITNVAKRKNGSCHRMVWIKLVNSSAVAEPSDYLLEVGLARYSMIRVVPPGWICPRADPTDLFKPSHITTKGQSFKLSKRRCARTVSLANVCLMRSNYFCCSGPHLNSAFGGNNSRRAKVSSACGGTSLFT
jgi:hypothetical protein